jgi:hypothetical protein
VIDNLRSSGVSTNDGYTREITIDATDRRRAGMKGIHRMTDTEQPFATPAGASADYQKTIRVNASPGALFDALTSVSGLAAWWVPRRHWIR